MLSVSREPSKATTQQYLSYVIIGAQQERLRSDASECTINNPVDDRQNMLISGLTTHQQACLESRQLPGVPHTLEQTASILHQLHVDEQLFKAAVNRKPIASVSLSIIEEIIPHSEKLSSKRTEEEAAKPKASLQLLDAATRTEVIDLIAQQLKQQAPYMPKRLVLNSSHRSQHGSNSRKENDRYHFHRQRAPHSSKNAGS